MIIANRLVPELIVDGTRESNAAQDTVKHAGIRHLEEKSQEYRDRRFRTVIADAAL